MRRLHFHPGGHPGRADVQGRRTTTWAAAAALALAVTGCGAVNTTPSPPDSEGAPTSSESPSPSASSRPIAAVEPADTVSWGGPAWNIITGEDALYVQSEGQIARIDPDTQVATLLVDGLSAAFGLNAGFGSVWASREHPDRGWIERFDAASGAKTAEIEVGLLPVESITAFGSIWVPNDHSGTVSRIDPAMDSVLQEIEVSRPGGGGPVSLAAGANMIWSVSASEDTITQIDPASNEVVGELPLSYRPCHVGYASGRVWAAYCDLPRVMVFDAISGEQVGELDGRPLAIDGGPAWLATYHHGDDDFLLSEIDLATLEVGETVSVAARPHSFAIGFGSVWVATGEDGRIHRYPLGELPGTQ